MRFQPLIRFALPAAAIAAASCVELTGQRLTIRYDGDRDQLSILIHYDGIYDSKERSDADGKEQIHEFIDNGNLMVLDWPFHVQMNGIRRSLAVEEMPPARRAFLEAVLANVRSQPLGRYRDPDGRIGAAQLVVVSNARALAAKASAAISEAILQPGESADWPRTIERWRAGAAAGRQWLAIEGHSIRFTFPAHLGEWVNFKKQMLKNLLDEVRKQLSAGDKEAEENLALAFQLLALSPLALSESAEEVSFRLGDPARPGTFRFQLRQAYTSNLEATVSERVPRELDPELAKMLLGEADLTAPSPLQVLRDWGPVEEKARALFNRAGGAEGAARKAALERLRSLALEVEREPLMPPYPPFASDEAAYLESWRRWYRDALRSSLPP